MVKSFRRLAPVFGWSVLMIAFAACVPAAPPAPLPPTTVPTTTIPPSNAVPIATPASGPAGSMVTIAAPRGLCDSSPGSPASTLIGGIAMPNGYVVVQSFVNAGPPAGGGAWVRVRLPDFTAAGTYNVFLACQTSFGAYAFGPGTFVVTA